MANVEKPWDAYTKPYRIVVNIIRGTATGRALELMKSGMQCAAESPEKAKAIVEDYIDAASAVLCNVDKNVCFGLLAILNTTNGHLTGHYVLMGQK